MATEIQWTEAIEKNLVGKTIAKVQYLRDDDAEEMDWFSRPLVIEFTDGSWIFPMQDDEGNDGGAFATSFDKLKTIPVLGRGH